MKVEIKAPEPPKTQIRQAGDVAARIVKEIGDMWKRDVIARMRIPPKNAFADALTPEQTEQIEQLSNAAVKAIRERFRKNKIAALTKDLLTKVDNRSAEEMRRRIAEKAIGVTGAEIRATSTKAFTEEFFKQAQERYQEIADGALASFQERTVSVLRSGGTLEDALKQFEGIVEERAGQAKMLARTQIQNFNSQVAMARAGSLGLEDAIWDSVNDGRTRESHRDRDGKTFKISDGLYSSVDGKNLKPGEDYNCRCSARFIVDV